MISFQLPPVDPATFHCIDFQSVDQIPPKVVSYSLSRYLYEIKEKLAHKERDWDVFKKYTNPYEYIHTIVPNRRYSVSSYKALSRSYFKMVEMIRGFALLPKRTFLNNAPIRTFHLAEGPGGFIEAVCLYRSNPEDQYVGMTILEDEKDDNVPAWRKSEPFLRQNPNVAIEVGADKTGNLLRIANFDHCVAKYGGSIDFITADGGFDFSEDFNHQELTIVQLLWGQVAYALVLQKPGGHFVLKMFDSFFQATVDILYLLSAFYEEVHVVKLRTSRVGNSEKYVVCKRFRNQSKQTPFLPFIRTAFLKCIESNPDHYCARVLNTELSRVFLIKLEEINAVFGQQQIENIHFTLSLIDKSGKHERVEKIIAQNVQKCIQWCIEHGIYYNVYSGSDSNSNNTMTIRPKA